MQKEPKFSNYTVAKGFVLMDLNFKKIILILYYTQMITPT